MVATVSAAAIEKEPENQSASNANSVKEKRAILVHHTSPIVSYHSPVITTVHHSAPLIHAAPIIHHPVHSVVATHAIHPVYSSHVKFISAGNFHISPI